MNIKKRVLDALKETQYPCYYATNFNGNDDTFCVFYILNEETAEVLDDEEASTYYKIQVQLISNTDYSDLDDKIMKTMKKHGFRRLNSAETYDSDTGFYSKAIHFSYIHYNYLDDIIDENK